MIDTQVRNGGGLAILIIGTSAIHLTQLDILALKAGAVAIFGASLLLLKYSLVLPTVHIFLCLWQNMAVDGQVVMQEVKKLDHQAHVDW